MLASRVRATELDPSGNTVVLSVLCRSRPPRYKRVTRTSVEESPSQLGRSDNRPLLAIKVALVGVIVVTLSAAGWRGVTQSDTRTEVASGPEPVLTSLASVTSPAVLGELPKRRRRPSSAARLHKRSSFGPRSWHGRPRKTFG